MESRRQVPGSLPASRNHRTFRCRLRPYRAMHGTMSSAGASHVHAEAARSTSLRRRKRRRESISCASTFTSSHSECARRLYVPRIQRQRYSRPRLIRVEASICRLPVGSHSLIELPRPQMTIALVPPLVEPAVGHGVLDGALVLVGMGAVGIPAEADVGPQVAVEAHHLLGRHVPKLKLPHAGRVDHVSAAANGQQPGGGSRMFAFLGSRRSPAARGAAARDRWRSRATTCPRRSVRPPRSLRRPARGGTAPRRSRSSRSRAAPRSPSGCRPRPAARSRPGRPGRFC